MDLMQLMETRRTYRRFLQKPIPQEVLDDIVNALRYSSSARNAQPIRILLIQQPEDILKVNHLVKWAAALPPELGTPKSNELPTLFIAVLDDTSVPGSHDVDAGIALANMTLAAWAHGVGSCIMQAINRPALTELFSLPDTLKLHSMIAFGYPSHKSTLVSVDDNGSLAYYLDENKDYCVPRYSTDSFVQVFRPK